MKVKGHRLVDDDGTAYPFTRTPNGNGPLQAEYLVIHYTAGRSAEESVSWLANPASRASAHLVIGRDGSITQLAPLDRVTWHAGRSRWDGKEGLNRHSLGIELDNAGRLTRRGSKWLAWFGEEYDEKEVLEAVHKHESAAAGWHVYTPQQLEVVLEVAGVLVEHYGLRDVIGHEDISPGRKSDPGPAFPMQSFRARLMGRAENEPETHETLCELNIRSGPGAQFPGIPGSPLPQGMRVEIVASQGSWRLVDVLGVVGGAMDMQGWVHGRFLRRVE